MKRIPCILVVIILCLFFTGACFAAPGCQHLSCTRSETVKKKDEPIYCNACQYYTGSHPHIHEFWKVTGTDKCDTCGKTWTVYEYTVNIRTYCPCASH